MGDQENSQIEDGTGGVDRRMLLKGAIATGVGVAAWSVPSITSLGGTPAYAAVCTVGFTTYNLNVRNTDCGPCAGDAVRYKPWTTNQCPTDNYSPGAALASKRCGGPTGGDGVCPPDAGVCVGGVPTGQVCKLRVIIQQGNCGDPPIRSALSASFTTATFVPLPAVVCGPLPDGTNLPGNIFARIQIVCSTQEACLPTS